MSDEWGEGEAVPAAPVHEGPTAGALLRQAREAAGLHVAALAVALKVPVRKLEALEDDRHDLMPDNVFVRGLAASVCRTLKIDPQPIMERLPQRAAPRLVRTDEGVNAPFRAASDAAPPTWFAQLTRPVFLAVFALLFGALILILLPVARDDVLPRARVETAPLPAATPLVIPGEAPAAPASGAAAPPGAVESAAPAPEATQALALAPAASVAVPPVPVAAGSVAAPVEPAVAAVAANSTVVFRAKGPSWVEVTDARGAVTLRKVLAQGEAVGADGVLPLRVTVGRTDMTDVEVRGKPFDLAPHSKSDNVARFEVR
ncbi:helix-turn-helix domain-containing protein [Caenimonas sp. SL110]|uniref:helix-turn-helix domain-containing protein n=1 Tax=Caenimonas sp. SL110 TaxID=1450524 RepID=UPI0006542752|nr:helix-turn-helix domain-containing protein [Caenimonas sp. SL110]